ncbi:hypothetical protein MPH_10999 [Macrophomina phaseolina MS6]|uniref:Rhodopsin domain-containing protein n=1 Tax=Macrophomina phaseolina (strain MS6) TaxID=1126212 RepID=K2S5H2_MACPH|nr:hypothetical protein MPH_10999 [Macrophomina phaseolina MS6]
MLRLKWMIQFASTQNVTWDYVPIGYWSTIEVHAGILCACLPAMRALLYKWFPRLAGRGSSAGAAGKYSNGYYGDGTNRSRGGGGGAIDTSTSIVQRVSKAEDGYGFGYGVGSEWVKLDEVESVERGESAASRERRASELPEGLVGGKRGVTVSSRCYAA